MNTRALIGSFATIAALLATAVPASAAVVINEVESDDPVVADFVEVMNTGAAPVDIGGYVIKDSDNGHVFTIPSPTIVAADGYYAADPGFGLGKDDQARLFAPADLINPIDSYAWTAHAAATYGRCPNGTGPMGATSSSTRGAANVCPVPAVAWPGSASVATADDADVFGRNLSGLAYQPASQGSPAVLWAVRNSPSTLFRLIHDGTKWTPDTANGWANGKTLVYPNGGGVPDAEGVTLAGGDANGIYVSVERNDSGANADISRPGVLRFDVTGAGSTLTAATEWNMTGDLPGLGKNAGLEAIAWVPDELLVAKGLIDDSTGKKYDPATHANHGKGLFFTGVEQDGRILAYALDQVAGTYTRVATIASGFPKIMDLTYDPETTHLWAVCDNDCDGRTATLDIAASGRFEVTNVFERPAGMPNINNEGFAIAPQSECVAGLKPVFYADDDNTGGHALRTGAIKCTVLPKDDKSPSPTPDQPATPQPTATPTPAATPAPTTPAADRTAPQLKLALKARRTGKLDATITLSERADLTLTVKAGKRTLAKTTRKGIAAGKRTIALKVKGARRGTKLTLIVQARDAAGNLATRSVSAKVK